MTSEIIRLATFANVPPRLAGLVAYRAMCAGVGLRTLRSADKRRELVAIRRRIAREAKGCGFSLWQIGRALNRDHSTILFHLKDIADLSTKSPTAAVADASAEGA